MSACQFKSSLRIAGLLAALAALLVACGGGGVTPTPGTGGGGTGGGGGGGGGGGTGASATPYVLFASNYVVYSAQTNGAWLHSIQSGDLYAGFGGNYSYGCYSAGQKDIDRIQFYIIQAQANGDGQQCGSATSSTAPTSSGDYAYVAIKAPASNGAGVTTVPPIDISQATTLLIQMGNTVAPDASHGHVNVFTVVLTNDPQGNGSAATATATCSFDQTLATVGAGAPSALGVVNYAIPLASFTCSPGTMSALQTSGITSVAVKFTGDKNPSAVSGEFDTIAVGYVGFMK